MQGIEAQDMFKRIVVTMDDTKSAHHALDQAIQLAKEQKAKLRIVHVVDYVNLTAGVEGVNIERFMDSIKEFGKDLLKRSVERAAKKGVKAERKLIESSELMSHIAEKILADATKWRSDLIVIGTHGRRGIKRLFWGSVAESIMRDSTIPILVFRKKKRAKRS